MGAYLEISGSKFKIYTRYILSNDCNRLTHLMVGTDETWTGSRETDISRMGPVDGVTPSLSIGADVRRNVFFIQFIMGDIAVRYPSSKSL
jgi:hypothetical protein